MLTVEELIKDSPPPKAVLACMRDISKQWRKLMQNNNYKSIFICKRKEDAHCSHLPPCKLSYLHPDIIIPSAPVTCAYGVGEYLEVPWEHVKTIEVSTKKIVAKNGELID